MHKLVNLYTESTKFTSKTQTGTGGELRIAPVKLSGSVVSACLDLIAKFRRMALRADPLIFDLSHNSFSDEYMVRATQLVKLCSINLRVLKLDGNYLSHQTLQVLKSTLLKQTGGAHSLQILSMNDCGLHEIDHDNPF